ncbi:hypothetical protein NPIL_364991 [Nephila pilipes]|uniref:Uncharacterized protein n=1 Tax=Nephila pilipes TaxID=299642 RepID=A0A8X6QQK8_NEPPI|nr:hypothetical protein NPIL_364991 [Nephila pilipes]
MKVSFELVKIIEEYKTIKESFKKDFPKKFKNLGPSKYFDGPHNNFQNREASDCELRNVKQKLIIHIPTITLSRSQGQKKSLCYYCDFPDYLSHTCPKQGE